VHVSSSCAGTYPVGVRLVEFQNKDAYKTRIRGGVETLHRDSHLSNLLTRRCFKFDQPTAPCDEGDKGVLTPKCIMHNSITTDSAKNAHDSRLSDSRLCEPY